MNILGNNANKLNDVIFENRNKNYGAYDIRLSYNDSLKKSLMYLISILTLLFGYVIINNRLNVNETSLQPNIIDDLAANTFTYSTVVDLKPPTIEPIQNTAVAATAPAGGMPTQIVDVLTNTTVANIENSVSGVGTETATGLDPVGAETSSITSNHVESTASVSVSEELVIAEEMPEFEGGSAGLIRYLAQNVIYPPLAKEIGKEGTVYVSFVVNEIGNVENAKVMRGIGYGCDEEVLRVVNKMPRWKKVGKNGGHPVKVRFNIPVSFKLK